MMKGRYRGEMSESLLPLKV